MPTTYIATMPIPDSTIPRRNVAAASSISSPRVGASSRPANAKVMVANRLKSDRSRWAGRSACAVRAVALPRDASDQTARAMKIAAGSHVP